MYPKINIHPHTHACGCVSVHLCIQVYLYWYSHIPTQAHQQIASLMNLKKYNKPHVYTCLFSCTHTQTYICVFACMCLSMYICKHKEIFTFKCVCYISSYSLTTLLVDFTIGRPFMIRFVSSLSSYQWRTVTVSGTML